MKKSHMRLHHLRVKRVELVGEIRYIKSQEDKLLKRIRKARKKVGDAARVTDATELLHSFHHHRVTVVRPHLRAAHLANGFLRGTHLLAMEKEGSTPPNWDYVFADAWRFRGDLSWDELCDRFDEWLLEAGLDPEEVIPHYGSVRGVRPPYESKLCSPLSDEPEARPPDWSFFFFIVGIFVFLGLLLKAYQDAWLTRLIPW